MRKRKKSSARSARRSRSRRSPRKATPRARPSITARAIEDKSIVTANTGGGSSLPRRRRVQKLQTRNGLRPTAVRPRRGRTATPRLSTSLVPTRARNADAPRKKAVGICKQAKETRRSVIIANGFGGKNAVRQYSKRRTC